jgi:ATP-dependent exoDNAse (exonuclease V) beta subunit
MRIGPDGRFGLRLAEPGTGRREPALDYRALGEERQRVEDEEERRLFYVAMTRARERLVLSGAARLDAWQSNGTGGAIGWIAPAFVPEIAARVGSESRFVADGVDVRIERSPGVDEGVPGAAAVELPDGEVTVGDSDAPVVVAPPHLLTPERPAPPVSTLSYSALAEYSRCGYRFYTQRVLGLPSPEPEPVLEDAAREPGLSGIERGILAHALLEALDFRRPLVPSAAAIVAAAELAPSVAEAEELEGLIRGFASSQLCGRLGRAVDARREERFAFLLPGGVMMVGVFDVLAREPGNRLLVVDYKSDRLQGADPAAIVAASYRTQQQLYALAALRAGAEAVEVMHVFLEAPDDPVIAAFSQEHREQLEGQLQALTAGVLGRDFAVADQPHRAICHGCPAEGGLCSWPLEATRRDAPDRLF